MPLNGTFSRLLLNCFCPKARIIVYNVSHIPMVAGGDLDKGEVQSKYMKLDEVLL
jgi:hypothetical protein